MSEFLFDFFEKYIKSFCCWDLIIFFHDNDPLMRADPLTLVNSLGKSKKEISSSVGHLVKCGLLREKDGKYGLTSDERMLEAIKKFVNAVDERSNRFALINHLLRKEANS